MVYGLQMSLGGPLVSPRLPMSANNHVNCITVSPQQVSTLSSATPTFVSPHHQNMVTVQGQQQQQQQQQQQHQQQGQQQYVLTIQQSPVTTAAAVGCQDSADESKSTALQQVQVLQQQQQQQQHHQMKYAIQTGPNQQTFLAASPQLAQHYAGAQAITLNQQAQPQQPQQAVAYIQGPNGQTFVQQYSPSNATIVGNNQAQVASQQTAQPQLYTPPTIVQNGTQYMIASNNQTGAVLQGYQTVQTATGQQVLIPTMAPAGSSQFISTPMVSQAAVSAPQMNQMVQIVLGNGQTLTTTLANLQAMGINTGISQQYGSYQCANANTYQASVQTQLITNSAGQVFAVTPQMVPNTQTQPSILAAAQNTAQYIQIANPAGGVALMSLQNQHIQQSSTNHAPVATPAPSVQVQPSNPTPESEATRLHVQQIIQQQQQILQQQQQQHHTLTQTATKQIAISEARSEPLHVVHDKSPKEKSNATYQETQMSPANSSGSGTPQPTVSSTTSNKPTSTSSGFSPNAAASQSMDSNPDLISVQSQTSSPASSNGSNMEPESTTQNVNTVADASIVDGVNLEEIKEFARQFKLRRISLGLTQTQVGQALSATEGPSYSQSAICRFEKLDITPKSAQKIKPVLERWMEEAEERYKAGNHTLTDFIGTESNKKRKRRTSFTPAALDILNSFFEKNTHPSGTEMTELAERLNYDREVVRVWFCNKRQALRNTIKRLEPTTVVLA